MSLGRQVVVSSGRSASQPYSLTALQPFILTAFLLLVGCEKKDVPRLPDVKPGEVMPLTAATFDTAIKKGVVLVDFWAEWCGPCKEQSVVVAGVAAEMGNKVRVANLDLGPEEAREKVVSRFNLEYIPTLIVFKNGEAFTNFVGLTPKEAILEAINQAQK